MPRKLKVKATKFDAHATEDQEQPETLEDQLREEGLDVVHGNLDKDEREDGLNNVSAVPFIEEATIASQRPVEDIVDSILEGDLDDLTLEELQGMYLMKLYFDLADVTTRQQWLNKRAECDQYGCLCQQSEEWFATVLGRIERAEARATRQMAIAVIVATCQLPTMVMKGGNKVKVFQAENLERKLNEGWELA